MNLEGKNALVTGGDRGIGQAISLALAQKRANVAVHYYRNEKEAQETVTRIQKSGLKTLKVKADVSVFSQVEEMVSRVKTALGSIDILVVPGSPDKIRTSKT